MTGETPRLSEILGGDHDDLDRRWEEIESTPPGDTCGRRLRFDSFRAGLLGHIAVEEERLFPILRSGGPSERILAERLIEEHRQVRESLAEIDRALTAGVGSLQRLGFDLINVLWEHNSREEAQAYPWLDAHLTPEQVLDVQRCLDAREPK